MSEHEHMWRLASTLSQPRSDRFAISDDVPVVVDVRLRYVCDVPGCDESREERYEGDVENMPALPDPDDLTAESHRISA